MKKWTIEETYANYVIGTTTSFIMMTIGHILKIQILFYAGLIIFLVNHFITHKIIEKRKEEKENGNI